MEIFTKFQTEDSQWILGGLIIRSNFQALQILKNSTDSELFEIFYNFDDSEGVAEDF